MALAAEELYELFLTLTPSRIGAARAALDVEDATERAMMLEAALVPLAVDAALLGADGVSALAQAGAYAARAPVEQVASALDVLSDSADALGHGDASGARVNEGDLRAQADELRAFAPRPAPAEESAAAAAPEDVGDESTWVPQIADDMIAAFLDECVERIESLSERLLELETRSDDKELVNEIFRDLHTLKGSSAFAGLKKMNRVAHRAEDLIGELRDGKRQSNRALIDVLLETLDTLRAVLDCARAGTSIDVEVADLVRRLENPDAAGRPAAPTLEVAAAAPTPARPAPRQAAAKQATLRIDFSKVDELLNLVGEVVLARGRLLTAADDQGGLVREIAQLRKKIAAALSGSRDADNAALVDDFQRTERILRESFSGLESGLGGLGIAAGQLRDNVMKLRMVPIARLFTKYQRTVRELSHKLDKEVHVELVGAETELDKVLVERLEDPLLHLVRNSVDHGVEKPDAREAAGKDRVGTVKLVASQRGGQIIVRIEDDGGGMDGAKLRAKALEKEVITAEEAETMTDAESYDLIFRAGFSTAAQVSDVSGRGVGMDVVRDAITKLKGTIHIDSTLGAGSAVELRLPLTLAITQILAARVGGELVAVPLDAVVSTQSVSADELETVGDGVVLRIGDRLIPVLDLTTVLGLPGDVAIGEAQEASVIVVDVGSDRLGLLVQQVLGRHEVVIKSLGPLLSRAPCAAGATLVGDQVLLVVDLAQVAERGRQPATVASLAPRARSTVRNKARVLVAEDSAVIRETLRRELTAAGFDVTVAEDGREALDIASSRTFDAVSTDVMMPNLDGYELARALRADTRYKTVPIVMVTSKDAKIDTMRGYDAGADAYITKPADAGELIRTLDSLLSRAKSG